MKHGKRWVALLFCLPLLCVTVHASAEDYFDIGQQLEASGAYDLPDALPEETADDLRGAGLASPEDALNGGMDAGALLRSAADMTQRELRAPLASLGILTAVLLLAALCKGGEEAVDTPLSSSAGTVISAAVSITLAAPVLALTEKIAETIDKACTFTESLAAVLLGILVTNGENASAAGYSAFVFAAVEAETVCLGEILLPLLRIFLAFSCVGAISQQLRMDALIGFFEKNARWLLGFLAATLSSVLALTGAVAAAADSMTARTAKFLIAGSVPVVGGAVGDAYLTLRGGMNLLRNSVGAFGIIATAYIFLPLLIRTALWRTVAEIGLTLCEALELDTIKKLMKSLSGVISLMLGALVFSLFLLTLGSIIVVTRQ